MDILAIVPCVAGVDYQANVRLPSSKSVLNRLIFLAALSRQTVRLKAASFGEDSWVMINCLKSLGVQISVIDNDIIIEGTNTNKRVNTVWPNLEAVLNFDNAGTALRFVSASLCLQKNGVYYLTGSAALEKRPIHFLLGPLEAQGCIKVKYLKQDKYLPCIIYSQGFLPSCVTIDSSLSSQGVSALMLVGFLSGIKINFLNPPSAPFIAMTLKMLQAFDVDAKMGENQIDIQASSLALPKEYTVSLDASAASYFAAWVIVTKKKVFLEDYCWDKLQADHQFLLLLKELGYIDLSQSAEGLYILPKASGSILEPIVYDFREISDTFISLAAISPLLNVSVHIKGIKHTQHQESKRVKATAQALINLGQAVVWDEDSLFIQPDLRALKSKRGLCIDVHDDHRLAMGFAILGSFDLFNDKKPWLNIQNPLASRKTFPSFFETLNRINYGL